MVEPVLITLGLVLLNVYLVYKYMTWHFNVWKKIGLFGPKPSVPFGNFGKTLRGKQHFAYELDDIYSEHKKSHRAIGIFMSRVPQILALDPKLAAEVMVTNFRKYRNGGATEWIMDKKADRVASENPFLTSGDGWKTKRADIIGGLSANKLNMAYPIWKAAAKKLNTFLEHQIAGNGSAIIETKNLAYCFTTDVLGDFLWGIDAKALSDGGSSNTILKMERAMVAQFLHAVIVHTSLVAAPFLKRFFNCRIFPDVSDRFFTRLTKDALEARRNDSASSSRTDYLNYIVQLQEKRRTSLDTAVGYIATILLDGFETSANVISHTLFYLAKYPHFQEKLREEILANLDSEGSVAFDTLNSLPYLDQCVNETLRMITPIHAFSRICTEPTEMELNDGRTIPISVGTTVIIPTFSYHHDADFFPEPYVYNPDRFDGVSIAELGKQGIYIPFGSGPRICLGVRVALLEVKTALVEILRQYRALNCAKTMAETKPNSNSFVMAIDGDFWLQYERL